MAERYSGLSLQQTYENYKRYVKHRMKKVEHYDEKGLPIMEDGEIKVTYVKFGKRDIANMKAWIEAYECVTKHKGLGGHDLEESVEFCRKAIKKGGWDSGYGNPRAVTKKMKYLVSIYDEIQNGVVQEKSYDADVFEDSLSDSTYKQLKMLMPPKNRGYF